MTFIAFMILIILSICAWIIEGEQDTHTEINELISLIDQLEQEQSLMNNLKTQKCSHHSLAR